MVKMFLALVIALAVEGCASTRPVLYPNAHFNAVGAEAAERDIASCMELAESAGADAAGSDAGQAAARTAGGAAVGIGSGRRGRRGRGRGGLRSGDWSGQWRDRRTPALDIQQAETQSCLRELRQQMSSGARVSARGLGLTVHHPRDGSCARAPARSRVQMDCALLYPSCTQQRPRPSARSMGAGLTRRRSGTSKRKRAFPWRTSCGSWGGWSCRPSGM